MNDTQPSFHRGDKVCRPADWIDVVKFFGFNYVLHALTVVPPPGANIFTTSVTSLFAVLIPFTGVDRAMWVLRRFVFLWGGGDLGKALNAGALCMLVPAGGGLNNRGAVRQDPLKALYKHLKDRLRGLREYLGHCLQHSSQDPSQDPSQVPSQDSVPAVFDGTLLEQISASTTIVHGQYPADIRRLDTGGPEDHRAEDGQAGPRYTLVAVPPEFFARPLLAPDVKRASPWQLFCENFRRRQGEPELKPEPVAPALSCNYSFLKTIAGLIQILYGSYELYMISGDQIRQYGYAAYQFTVIPYVTMSIVNLLAGLSAPIYPARYIVHYRGLPDPPETKETAASGDPAEHGKQAVPAIYIPEKDICADGTNGAAAPKENAEEQAGEIYPQGWWDQEGRDAVEKNVGGAVGFVYGDFTKIGLAGRRLMPHDSNPFITGVVIFLDFALILLQFAAHAAPYVVIQVLTGFDNGESTVPQRVFIMAWIACGQLSVASFFTHHNHEVGSTIRRMLINSSQLKAIAMAGTVLVALFPPVAGFYTVSRMILNDRTCTRV